MLFLLVTVVHHTEDSGPWLKEYFHLLRDPAHILLELTLMLIFDVIIGLLLWPLVRSAFRAWLNKHDEEVHGK